MADENETELNLTDSAITSDSGVDSTPVSTVSDKANDEVKKFLQMLLEKMRK